MSRFILSGLLAAAMPDTLAGQASDPIQLDRPDQTETPAIVPIGYFQMENGLVIENTSPASRETLHPSSLWKYGISETVELRMITEFVTETSPSDAVSGMAPIALGLKANITRESGLVPMISFIGHLTVSQLASEPFRQTYVAPDFRFTLAHTVSDRLSIGYNLGAEWDGIDAAPTWIYTLAAGLSLTRRLGCYVEAYGSAHAHAKACHQADGGFTYLISPDIMADISGGIGLTDNAPDHYLAFGFSYRIRLARR